MTASGDVRERPANVDDVLSHSVSQSAMMSMSSCKDASSRRWH